MSRMNSERPARNYRPFWVGAALALMVVALGVVLIFTLSPAAGVATTSAGGAALFLLLWIGTRGEDIFPSWVRQLLILISTVLAALAVWAGFGA